MVQDIIGKININYEDIEINDNDNVLVFKNNEVLLIDFKLPKKRDIKKGEYIYLFSIENEKYFLLIDDDIDGKYVAMSEVREHKNINERFAIFTAKHLNSWYRSNIYCGKCASKLYKSKKERALMCDCGNIIYPRINPAVIVAILNKDKILLTKYAKGGIRYALVAGFVEIGETLEDTVKREVFEEVGLKVKNIRYYKSQPWGLTDSILAGYYCDVDGSDAVDISSGELKEATWFKRDELAEFSKEISLTNNLIANFKENNI